MRFIILGSARTGSTYLIQFLRNHPNIEVHGEILNLDNLGEQRLRIALENPINYLESELQNKREIDVRATGYKILYGNATAECLYPENHIINKLHFVHEHLRKKIQKFHDHVRSNYDLSKVGQRLEKLWKYLQSDLELRVIHIKRKNKLAALRSLTYAYMTNEWDKRGGDCADRSSTNEASSIFLPYDNCLDFFCKRSSLESTYENLFNSHKNLTIFYEDLCHDVDLELLRIYSLLQVPKIETKQTDMTKQNQQPLSQSITNYADLKSRFKKTPWEEYFVE